ncbi:MAG: hypothetical protein FWG41_06485 [Methanomassiliicoccaceae archaeon]|nr:hypothetical protein [Methanomassiliicoccaceae archaeon]
MAKKIILLIVVAILIVAVVAVGFFVLNNNDDKNTDDDTTSTYWYYVDYGAYETTDVQSGWLSAESNDPLSGFLKALDDGSIDYDIDSGGWITSINNVEPDYMDTGESWYTWGWAVSGNSGTWEELTVVMGDATETMFYVTISTFDADFVAVVDPNAKTEWRGGGPFAA